MPSAEPNSHSSRQLRLALALRGGASMAVWIGGAVAEIDRLRRWAPVENTGPKRAEQRHPWAELAELAGYESVEVDVLAGTSAGGLNATLLSASLVYGMPFTATRRAWIRLADLEAMARTVPRPWQPKPESLLEGDEYFRAELTELLTEQIGRERRTEPVERVELLLTATLLDPVAERHFDAVGSEFGKARRRAMFRFRHRGRPGEPLSDFGPAERARTTARLLAQAARASSSFPMAFEPAVFRADDSGDASDDRSGDSRPGSVPNLYGRFSEIAASAEQHFRVIDGGVLDNIPVTAAVDAIRRVEADAPTERWLLYLNPEPDSPSAETRGERFARAVTATALRAKLGQESLLTDIDSIGRHNESVRRAVGRRDAVLTELAVTPRSRRARLLGDRVRAVSGDYASRLAETRAVRVHELLTAPEDTTGTPLLDPIPKQPLREWPTTACTGLRERLIERYRSHAQRRPGEVFDDVRTLLSAVDECLRWVRELEAHRRSARIAAVKASLYRLRTVAETLCGHTDRCWTHAAGTEPVFVRAELDGWIGCVLDRHHRLQHALPSPVGTLLAPLLDSVLGEGALDQRNPDCRRPDGGTAEAGEHGKGNLDTDSFDTDSFETGADPGSRFRRRLAEFNAELSAVVNSSGAEAAENDVGVDAVAESWATLERLVRNLVAALSPGDLVEIDRVTRSLLELAADVDPMRLLRELVVLTTPMQLDTGADSHILLHRLAGDSSSPLPFTALRDSAGDIPLADKVRGSGLGNFGAFLSAKWRANDWMWGRLDAVAGLVPMLIEPDRLVRHSGQLGADGLGDALQRILSRPTEPELGELDETSARKWHEFLAERWAEHSGAVRTELEALFANPTDEHPLTVTRRAVAERLQWTVAAEEIPFVAAVDSGADPNAGDARPMRDPRLLDQQVRAYEVGKQRPSDLEERRMASLATRCALLAHRALLPGWRGFRRSLATVSMIALKPLSMLLAFALAAPRRAALGAALSGTAVALTEFLRSPVIDFPSDAGSESSAANEFAFITMREAQRVEELQAWRWLHVVEMSDSWPGAVGWLGALLAVVAALRWGWLMTSAAVSALTRALVGLAAAGLLAAAGFWLFELGVRLGPLGVTLAGAGITWYATFALRTSGRVGATVLSAVIPGLLLLPAVLQSWSVSFWLLAAMLLTAWGQAILLSLADVLEPRPRGSLDTPSRA
ncbi:patatin-related protein [Actinopolyspora mzabensis]|uniref:Patatin-related protein n=1 Tax=Actinopolyspora mzabensis TaxID=995066 RepID=A0A1G8VY06_ACTMZ|nr:patatin-like protein [Actinopolyspora mzabensis]SDJ70964.1 patatin-related protein [Actinopolyspora mzabensis]